MGILQVYQKFVLKKETTMNNIKKTKNLIIWLFVWYANSPPSVDYIAKKLIIPRTRTEKNKTKSSENILSVKLRWDCIDPFLNIIPLFHSLFYFL